MPEITARLSTALADRYKIESHLGEGGMANVYLAHDLKHDRKVAVKVLRPELAAVLGAERFVQEIKTTANLQHPHILPLFDSGEADSFLYYVMPFIDGETLRDKLNRETQLGIEEAVSITTAIADALDYAHRQNVIHRDIKPENILLHDGRPMVADFGIALALSAAAGGRMTETGMSLGTPHYMSPEQATAEKDLTNRSDIYSLACVLYEMLTGEPPHTGASAQAIIMKIVTEDVPLVTKVRKSVPPNVAAATAKALEKLPADRFASASKFAEALTNPAFGLATRAGLVDAVGEFDHRSRRAVYRTAAVASLLVVVAAWGWLRPGRETRELVTRFTVPVEGGHEMAYGWCHRLALSPDGRTLAYVAEGKLYVRALDRWESVALNGTQGAGTPFFSPDGRSIGFSQGNGIKTVSVNGGPVTPVTGSRLAGNCLSASWGEDGRIVYRDGGSRFLSAIPAIGGDPQPLTEVADSAFEFHMWPQVLDGGRQVLYTVIGPSGLGDDARIVLHDLRTNKRIPVVERGTYGRFVSEGYVLYVDAAGSVFALPFDLSRGTASGDPFPVAAGVRVALWGGAASFAVSDGGTAAFVFGSNATRKVLWWVDRVGRRIRSLGDPLAGGDVLDLSPDGRFVVTNIAGPANGDLWLIDTDTGERRRFTTNTGYDWTPAWSPDGDRIAYPVPADSGLMIYVQDVQPGSQPTAVYTTEAQTDLLVYSWSSDGWLAIVEGHGQWDIYAVACRRSAGSDSCGGDHGQRAIPAVLPGRPLAGVPIG